MDKIVNIQSLNPNNYQLQNYNAEDESLIQNFSTEVIFDSTQDYLEYFILDLNSNVLYSNTAGYNNYTILDNNVVIDPQKDLEATGYSEGQYYTIYNFLKRKLSSSPNSVFYIQDISSDRTELRLNTTTISSVDVIDLTDQLSQDVLTNDDYQDFYLNFGNNKLIIAVNIALDSTDFEDPTVLIKLYEPLPPEFNVKSTCWVVEQIAESKAYQIELTSVFDYTPVLNYISGPNLNLDLQDQINNSTPYYNQNTLALNASTLGTGSLLYQINSLLAEKGIEINIDYTDYSEFVHFSSAQTRLENFYYKISLLENYTANSALASTSPTNTFISSSQIIWNNKINDIITNFDGYEYYLYFESGSYAWPKVVGSTLPPYINATTGSVAAINWFTTQSISASFYDSENNNHLINAIPTYLREDPQNAKYELFIQMAGQHFDNIWVYLKDITNKFNTDNRLNYGISKDIVAQAIRDLGVKIYQNNFSDADIYSSLIGLTPSGSTLLLPFTTGSLPSPAGFEYINTYISASDATAVLSLNDTNKEIYKRIYHNLPILLKKKGTPEGLRLLINLYGIPDTILRINEFGGKSNSISNNWDNFQDQFNYSFNVSGSGYVQVNITPQLSVPLLGAYEFRFKTPGIPTSNLSQSILVNHASNGTNIFSVVLEYSGSKYTSASYSGSIADPYNEYGTLKLISTALTSASIYLPFFDGGWWSILVNNTGNSSSLYAKNKIYEGYDGNAIGFQGSGSVNLSTGTFTSSSLYLPFSASLSLGGKTYTPLSGSYQELRYYNTSLSESQFNDFVMNPYSIEGNTVSGSQTSLNTLRFRAPLGTVLDNDTSSLSRTSIHSSITSYPPTGSFNFVGSTTSSLYYLSGSFNFTPNTEVTYQDQFASGLKNAVTEKIKIANTIYPSGDTLSQYISIQQTSHVSESFTRDIDYVEVAFSPQDEVNDDIISQLGSFNIGQYIGDPRQVSSSLNYYPDFNVLRDEYFSKYTHSYDLWDYMRLIKFYDNSLFKMIKDFTPARTSLATGIVIKPTLLERCKYPLPQANTNTTQTYVGSPTTKQKNIPY
jgi:hypothetical protein